MAMSPRLLRPRASSSFTPKNLSGLELWLDAADGSTLFDADSGGSLVAADGAVGRWVDKSGNSRNFTQGTANNRPLWRATGKNGRGVLEFDGSNDRLVGPTTQFVKTNAAFTVLAVYLVNDVTQNFPTVFSTNTDQAENWRFIDSPVASYNDAGFGSASGNFGKYRWVGRTRGTWYAASVAYNGSGATTVGNYTVRQNASGQSLLSAGAYGNDSSSGSAVGAQSANSNFLNGRIAELCIYSKALSATELASMESYLNKKWSLY